jgi:hypothetical protein
MLEASSLVVHDGDGHLIEDGTAILAHAPAEYREALIHRTTSFGLPPFDHFHSNPMKVFGGTDGGDSDTWLRFMKEVGISTTVLYPTSGLSYGRITDPDWSGVYCTAYNNWISETLPRGLRPASRHGPCTSPGSD